MTRIRRGYIARRRRKKSRIRASGFSGSHSKCTRIVSQQEIRALASADRDRARRKRTFRGLWVIRINAAIRENAIYVSYSKFINNLYRGQLLLNRKILGQLAILHRIFLYFISNPHFV